MQISQLASGFVFSRLQPLGRVFRMIGENHEALGPSEGIARTTVVDSLVWWPAQAFARDRALNRIVAMTRATHAGRLGSVRRRFPAKRELMIFGFAKPMDTWNPDGPYSWKKFGSLISGENIVGLLAVQSVSLEPLFPSRYPVGPRRSNHAPSSRHQVGNDGLARPAGKMSFCPIRTSDR